jgi:hypothetical protein
MILLRNLPILLLALALAACGSSQSVPHAQDLGPGDEAARIRQGPPPVVVGTVIEASTGKALEGVLVTAPNGLQVLSAAQGRFVIEGLGLGEECFLEALTESGLRGRIPLRPLASGELEVVLFVR